MAEDTKPATKRGRPFEKGNPGGPGRPRMSEAAREMLADAETKAIKALVDGLQATKTATHEGLVIRSEEPDHTERRACGIALLERRLGKPAQAITGEDGGALQLEVEGVDLTKLSDVQFAALVALRDALKAGRQGDES